ncbi:MAG: hypothetical protein LBQ88_02920 [Treponema sp.]|nr:hypothetical protein [Treponema sp.]
MKNKICLLVLLSFVLLETMGIIVLAGCSGKKAGNEFWWGSNLDALAIMEHAFSSSPDKLPVLRYYAQGNAGDEDTIKTLVSQSLKTDPADIYIKDVIPKLPSVNFFITVERKNANGLSFEFYTAKNGKLVETVTKDFRNSDYPDNDAEDGEAAVYFRKTRQSGLAKWITITSEEQAYNAVTELGVLVGDDLLAAIPEKFKTAIVQKRHQELKMDRSLPAAPFVPYNNAGKE